jgi:hypothetical protein
VKEKAHAFFHKGVGPVRGKKGGEAGEADLVKIAASRALARAGRSPFIGPRVDPWRSAAQEKEE